MSSGLLLTPQLQLAVRLLSLSFRQVGELLDAEAARHGVLRRPHEGEVLPPDPFDLAEQLDADQEGRPPWFPVSARVLEPVVGEPDPDVWVVGSVVTANGTGLRFVMMDGDEEAVREARWLIKAARNRMRVFEQVAARLVAANRDFFTGAAAAPAPLSLKSVAAECGLHESTVQRVCAAGVLQSDRGIARFAAFTDVRKTS